MATHRFLVTGLPELNVQVGCPVEFVQADEAGLYTGETRQLGAEAFTVEVETEGDDITVSAGGNVVTVRQTGLNTGGASIGTIVAGDLAGGVTIVNGRVISGGRSISVSGGNINIVGGSGGSSRVTINGKVIDLDALPDAPAAPVSRVRIVAPRGSTLEGQFSGEARVTGNLTFGGAYVALSGLAEAGITVEGSLAASLSSSGRLIARVNGAVQVTASSSGSALLTGQFDSVQAIASSSGSIQTTGECAGDYNATASSSASITHRGPVRGRVRQRESSSGRVLVG